MSTSEMVSTAHGSFMGHSPPFEMTYTSSFDKGGGCLSNRDVLMLEIGASVPFTGRAKGTSGVFVGSSHTPLPCAVPAGTFSFFDVISVISKTLGVEGGAAAFMQLTPQLVDKPPTLEAASCSSFSNLLAKALSLFLSLASTGRPLSPLSLVQDGGGLTPGCALEYCLHLAFELFCLRPALAAVHLLCLKGFPGHLNVAWGPSFAVSASLPVPRRCPSGTGAGPSSAAAYGASRVLGQRGHGAGRGQSGASSLGGSSTGPSRTPGTPPSADVGLAEPTVLAPFYSVPPGCVLLVGRRPHPWTLLLTDFTSGDNVIRKIRDSVNAKLSTGDDTTTSQVPEILQRFDESLLYFWVTQNKPEPLDMTGTRRSCALFTPAVGDDPLRVQLLVCELHKGGLRTRQADSSFAFCLSSPGNTLPSIAAALLEQGLPPDDAWRPILIRDGPGWANPVESGWSVEDLLSHIQRQDGAYPHTWAHAPIRPVASHPRMWSSLTSVSCEMFYEPLCEHTDRIILVSDTFCEAAAATDMYGLRGTRRYVADTQALMSVLRGSLDSLSSQRLGEAVHLQRLGVAPSGLF